ncbi:MAG: hypothetical protein MJZ50_01750 [Treponema sp.]|nr:hypothetical protein [Treponema sp.]
MYKKYNVKNQHLERVVVIPDPDKVEARTRAFIQWCKFNKCKADTMALAILRQPKMHFLANCELLIDTDAKCKGNAFGKPYCYAWKDEYFELINKARKFFWKYIESKS